MAQWKRTGLITQRSEDRNLVLLLLFSYEAKLLYSIVSIVQNIFLLGQNYRFVCFIGHNFIKSASS